MSARTKRPAKVPVAAPEGAKLLTVPEAAHELRSCVDTVYRLIRDGAIASTRISGKRFVPRAAIEDYVSRQTVTARPAAAQQPPAASLGLRESGLWNGKDY